MRTMDLNTFRLSAWHSQPIISTKKHPLFPHIFGRFRETLFDRLGNGK